MAKLINLTANHLLIIEWLYQEDDKTGTKLAEYLSCLNVPVKIVSCGNRNEVLEALENACARIRSDGKIPVVQFDCHGGEHGFEGPDGLGGYEQLDWETLAQPLRTLNVLTRFNLVIVGAACSGLDSAKTFQGKGAAPFTIAIGFHDTISSGALFDSIKELHRGLFKSSDRNITRIVKSANEQIGVNQPGRLLAFDCLTLGARVVGATVEASVDFDSEIRNAEKQLPEIQKVLPETTLANLLLFRCTHTPAIAQRIVNGWFAYDEIEENRARFAIDVERMYAEARAGALGLPFGRLVEWCQH